MAPVMQGRQSLYEVKNYWSLADLYLWILNFGYQSYLENQAQAAAEREAKRGGNG